MPDALVVEMEDHEPRHRPVPRVGEREGDAGRDDGTRHERRALTVGQRLGRRVRFGDLPRHERAQQRCHGCEHPHRVVPADVEDQVPEDRPGCEPAPDREPEQADRLAAPVRGRQVDDPRGAAREHPAVTDAEDEPGDDEARDAERQEVQKSGDARDDEPG